MSTSADEAWLKTRPECVQKLAKEFPLNITVQLKGKLLYMVGYNEKDTLIMSEINPSEDYEGAIEHRVYICAEHLREARLARRRDS